MSKVKVVPCSGIGKVFGLMAREAALTVTGRLAPDTTETACLAHLVTGDEEAKAKVAGCTCITVDGCPALCAAKSVEAAGGIVKAQFRAVDEMRKHRGANAGTGTALTEDGWAITDELAKEIADKAEELLKEGN
ncbi:putative zinc-binding protein [Lachnoclostridium pacaense]|uniref:putative zinc-binding protein n=1 Tax=Enterocloster hominis (ex Hitch et al. 2024) TaxID=1917870 RepID=UPI001D10EB7C|nr:putative zinc-binding protein [Lachnoclostridium pacaense]MCC2817255.1 putative zinc-binding protein [Lachnoclostridium pacaense]